jgi:membrane associated rhomboid family serine protease
METVSAAVLTLIAGTFIVLALRRYSPTLVLAISNVIIFTVIEIGYGKVNLTLSELGLRPSYLFAGKEPWTLITSMFLHADLYHLIFNLLFLIAIGLPLESRIGKWRFMAVYLLGGIAGSMLFAVVEWSASQNVILIGASGAISALLGAMLALYPREKIMFFLGPLLTNRFSVWVPIVVWFLLQLIFYSFDNSPVAYAAHIGGFAAGIGIASVLRPRSRTADGQPGTVDISPLKALCATSALAEMYRYAENAKDDETRDIWTDRILEFIICPVCGSAIKRRRKGFECTNGHEIK